MLTKRLVGFVSFGAAATILLCCQSIGVRELAFADELPSIENSATQTSPEIAASAFYHWYLRALASGQKPLRSRAVLRNYLSQRLFEQVEHPPKIVDEDYFIKAQDYLDDWITHIAVSVTSNDGGAASTIVTLGSAPSSNRRLALRLVHEGDSWRIARVDLAP